MFIKTISFDNLDGETIERTFHFHMNKADLAEFMLDKDNDFPTYFRELVKQNKQGEIIKLFKALVAASVGRRDDDGIVFEKTPEFTKAFMSSNAYSEFFEEMITDTQKMITFFNGVMPKGFSESLDAEIKKTQPRTNNQSGAKRKKNNRQIAA